MSKVFFPLYDFLGDMNLFAEPGVYLLLGAVVNDAIDKFFGVLRLFMSNLRSFFLVYGLSLNESDVSILTFGFPKTPW